MPARHAFDSPTTSDTPTGPAAPSAQGHWDIFCRVVDNLGDVGVCWRLAADLTERGLPVRLIIDDASALQWMAPGQQQVQVLSWPGPPGLAADAAVCIEAFGCDPPPDYVQQMQALLQHRAASPVWLNLEYLSAERYVERSHRLPSPQPGGMEKWFFYPGFTPKTGGLLRERDLAAREAAFKRDAWLQQQGITLGAGERLVSLFCYGDSALPALLQGLQDQPTLLLLAPGPAQQQALDAARHLASGGLRLHAMPWLSQRTFDELLWACDLNFVRGEDSLVRALWAGQPFVWQAYRQQDQAHHAKVQALLDAWGPAPALNGVRTLWAAWNGMQAWPATPEIPALAAWQASVRAWRQQLWQQAPLAQQLLDFVHARQSSPQTEAATAAARI